MATQVFNGQKYAEAAQPESAPSTPRREAATRGITTHDLSNLLLSTALFEVGGNMVYVMLMERTFALGGPAGIGVFLLLQAAAQLLLGSLVGSFTNKLGTRRSEIFGLLALASLALGLALTDLLGIVYLLALLVTIARLFVVTSRLPLLSQLSTRDRYLRGNSAISVLEGIGLFVGPSLAAGLLLLRADFRLPLVVASGMFALSAIPLLRWPISDWRPRTMPAAAVLTDIKAGWRHIVHTRPIWEVLVCLAISSLAFGAIMPMLPSLARQVGLAMEGSGILVAAIGLGWTFGPLSAGRLVGRLSYTKALLVAGLTTPMAVLAIGYPSSVQAVVVALVAASFAGGCLYVVVITVVQRLTPRALQSSIMGTEQALSAVIWILSAGAVTLATAIAPASADPRWLFIPTGVLGSIAVLACWSFGRRSLQALMDGVAVRIR